MTKQEARAYVIRHCNPDYPKGETEWERAINTAIKALEQPEQLKWILCNERLPDEKEEIYWVCTDGGYQCQCRWTNVNHFWSDLTTDWHWHIMDIPHYTEVVAWMLLPNPYKVESENKE